MFLPEITEEVNKITILARKLKDEGFEDLQHNEVTELLKAHTEEVSEEKSECLVTGGKGEEQETDDQNIAHEQRLTNLYSIKEMELANFDVFNNGNDDPLHSYQEIAEQFLNENESTIIFSPQKNPNKIVHY